VVQLDTAALRSEATQGAPSIARAEASRRAAEAAVTVQKQSYLPRVTASYSNTRSGADIANMTKGWSLGVNLSWQIFNGFGRETQLVNALASRETAIAQEADARRLVDVLQAQAAHDQTQVDAVNARKAYQVAKASLSALVGREL
jgi:outer membrane protein TolC